jgi:hypothetical protein
MSTLTTTLGLDVDRFRLQLWHFIRCGEPLPHCKRHSSFGRASLLLQTRLYLFASMRWAAQESARASSAINYLGSRRAFKIPVANDGESM